jgi:hypothetical protein
MRVACITIVYNDDYKFEEWCKWYDIYRDELYLHIIVDNGSQKEFLDKVKAFFSNSHIIERKTNGGCTSAYNDGIRYALTDPNVDAIMLLGNDIKLNKGAVKGLYDYLMSDEKLGMVGPLVLKKDSDIIEDFGVNLGTFTNKFLYKDMKLSQLPSGIQLYVDAVPGGVSLSKREYYEKVGLQDENLFMYSDERDMAYRTKKNGYTEGVTSSAMAWHQHIKCPFQNKRLKSNYLIARNRIYLEKKHSGNIRAYSIAISTLFTAVVLFLRDFSKLHRRVENIHSIKGVFAGLTGNMDNKNLWY